MEVILPTIITPSSSRGSVLVPLWCVILLSLQVIHSTHVPSQNGPYTIMVIGGRVDGEGGKVEVVDEDGNLRDVLEVERERREKEGQLQQEHSQEDNFSRDGLEEEISSVSSKEGSEKGVLDRRQGIPGLNVAQWGIGVGQATVGGVDQGLNRGRPPPGWGWNSQGWGGVGWQGWGAGGGAWGRPNPGWGSGFPPPPNPGWYNPKTFCFNCIIQRRR